MYDDQFNFNSGTYLAINHLKKKTLGAPNGACLRAAKNITFTDFQRGFVFKSEFVLYHLIRSWKIKKNCIYFNDFIIS